MCSTRHLTEQEMSRAPLNINQNKGQGGHRQHSDRGGDTQGLEWEQHKVRDGENRSKVKVNSKKSTNKNSTVELSNI